MQLTKSVQTQILTASFELLRDKYIFPQVAGEVIATISERHAAGGYDHYADGAAFAAAKLTHVND